MPVGGRGFGFVRAVATAGFVPSRDRVFVFICADATAMFVPFRGGGEIIEDGVMAAFGGCPFDTRSAAARLLAGPSISPSVPALRGNASDTRGCGVPSGCMRSIDLPSCTCAPEPR